MKEPILIVDDEVEFAKTLSTYFRGQGYPVHTSTNLEDAINIFKREKPKVVLLDFNMPIANGDQFLPILQNILPTVRIIVVTGCAAEEVEDRFRGLGYFSLFEKGGLSLEKLKMKVDEAISY
jgi:DNA-binding response OmpR family regulator